MRTKCCLYLFVSSWILRRCTVHVSSVHTFIIMSVGLHACLPTPVQRCASDNYRHTNQLDVHGKTQLCRHADAEFAWRLHCADLYKHADQQTIDMRAGCALIPAQAVSHYAHRYNSLTRSPSTAHSLQAKSFRILERLLQLPRQLLLAIILGQQQRVVAGRRTHQLLCIRPCTLYAHS